MLSRCAPVTFDLIPPDRRKVRKLRCALPSVVTATSRGRQDHPMHVSQLVVLRVPGAIKGENQYFMSRADLLVTSAKRAPHDVDHDDDNVDDDDVEAGNIRAAVRSNSSCPGFLGSAFSNEFSDGLMYLKANK